MTSAHPDGTVVLDAPDRSERLTSPAATQRIAFVVSTLDEDPAGDTALAWISYFADAGNDVEAVAIRGGGGSDALPASVPLWRPGRARGLARTARALAKQFEQRQYDVVVAVGTVANVVAVAGRRRSAHRPVLVLAEQDLLSLNAAAGAPRARVRARLARRHYRHADAVISPSHAIAAEIAAASGVPSSRSLVVPNPVLRRSAVLGGVASGGADRMPRERGTAGGVQLVLLSPLVPEKNPELALRTAKALSGRGIPAEVVALEGGPLSDDLSALAASMGVRFTPLAGAADPYQGVGPRAVALLPSQRQGSGDELVRAAARGMPAVALSTALGVAEGIIPGVTGELALDDDPESVADAIVTAASLPVEEIDGWLDRFGTEGSGTLLAEVIAYASTGRV